MLVEVKMGWKQACSTYVVAVFVGVGGGAQHEGVRLIYWHGQ